MPCREGDVLTLYRGQRTKNCEKLMTVTCASVQFFQAHLVPIYDENHEHTDGYAFLCVLNGEAINHERSSKIALADGFQGHAPLHSMFHWLEKTHGLKEDKSFNGWLIKWAKPKIGAEK